jgi:predicted acetyltransferase
VLEIKPPQEDDRPAMARVVGLAFNYQANADNIKLKGKLCAFDGGTLVGTAGAHALGQWFGGRAVPCAGVAAVAVLPEHRGRGAASRLLVQLLHQERAQGRVVSTLYPANAPLYRKLGYEFAGLRPQMVVPVADLPPGPTEGLREMRDEDVPALEECFSRFAAGHNGPVMATEPGFFTDNALAHSGEGAHQRTVLVDGADGPQGYASYFTDQQNFGGYRLTCKHLVALGADGLRALLAYFRRFENSARTFAWYGPSGSPSMSLALGTNGFALESSAIRWMARLLDVPAALEARGYPPVDGEVTIEVDDPVMPGNRGPWLVRADGGRVRVTPGGGGAKALSVNALSALYTGYATPSDLVLTGNMEAGDQRGPFLTALFAGASPWMPDFF